MRLEAIRAIPTPEADAALAHLKDEIVNTTLAEMSRDGKELIVGCGEPFRMFSDAALAKAIEDAVRQARLDEAKEIRIYYESNFTAPFFKWLKQRIVKLEAAALLERGK